MKLVDLNVLLYAINRSAAHHDGARRWWESAVGGSEPVGLAWIVIGGFLRLVTRAAIFPRPLIVEQACARVDHWLDQPSVRILRESDQHWSHMRRLTTASGTGG